MEWRKNVHRIRLGITGSVDDNWRQNFIEIAKSKGLVVNGWRGAIIATVASLGKQTQGWREALAEWVLIIGKVPRDWRTNLYLLAEYYSGVLPVGDLFCLNTLPVNPQGNYIWMDDKSWNDSHFWID